MGLLVESASMIPAAVPLEAFKQPKGLVLLAIAFALFVRYVISLAKDERDIVNRNGQKMKELKHDTRFTRFTKGSDISAEGRAVAGDDPFLVRNSGKRELVLTTPEHLRDFFKNDATAHFKPYAMNLGHYFGRVLGQCVGVKGGDKWTVIRQQTEPHFSHGAVRDFVPQYAEEFKQWLKELPEEATAVNHSKTSFSIDALAACRYIPFKMVGMACYGDELTPENYQKLLSFNEVHERIMRNAVFSKPLTSSWYGMLPTKEKLEMDKFQADWEDFNMFMVNESRKHKSHCPVEIIYGAVEKGTLEKLEWLQTIDEILFTNIDVTSSVLAFLLINLAKYQDVQVKLREEVAVNCPATGDAEEHQKAYDYIHKSKTLLNNVIMESLRISPAAWFSLPEFTSTDKIIGGFMVPKGTPAIIDWKRVNTKSKIWGADGDEFRPTRFDELTPSQYRYSFLQFGVGTRKCLGKNVSNILLKLFLMAVLRKYDLSGVEMGTTPLRKDVFTCTPEQVVKFTERA